MITSFRGAPPHVKKHWERTFYTTAIFHLAERMGWEKAHQRLTEQWDWDWERGLCGYDGSGNMIRRSRVYRMELKASYLRMKPEDRARVDDDRARRRRAA